MNLLPRFLILALPVALLLPTATLRAQAKPDKKTDEASAASDREMIKAVPKAKITLSAAIKTALAKVPGSKAVEAFFEVEDQDIFYAVEVVAAGKHQIVDIDAVTGKVNEVTAAESEDKEEQAREEGVLKAKISLLAAIDVALKKVPQGKPFDVQGGQKNGKFLIYVDLLEGGKIIDVDIDPTTGDVVSAETAKD